MQQVWDANRDTVVSQALALHDAAVNSGLEVDVHQILRSEYESSLCKDARLGSVNRFLWPK